jgi:uncharacterized membrane protein
LLLIVRILLSVATALSGYLLSLSRGGNSYLGCGSANCHDVLQSRWGYWLGIPVSLPALLLYLALLVVTFYLNEPTRLSWRKTAWTFANVGALTVVGAVLWFAFLQIAVLRKVCPVCMGTHLAGLVAACGILSVSPLRQPKKAGKESLSFPNPGAKTLLSALVGLTVLVVGQIAYQTTGSIVKVKSPGTSVDPANTKGRSVSLLNGQFRLSLQDEPLVGDPNAPHVLVNLFDYTCYACRVLHEQLAEAQKALSNQFVVVSLPAPLNRACNPAVTEAYPGHEEGCQYARVGLAVWRAKPSAFGPFTDWVFASEYPPPVAQAQLRAEELVGKQALASALQDSRIEEEIRRNVAIYATNYLAIGQHSLPQLFVGTNLTVGAFRKKEGLLKLLQDELHLKVD